MNITQKFTVNKPVEAVWVLFQDVPSLAECLPGAELVEDKGNGLYAGTMEAKLGPMKAKFEGTALVTMDPVSKTAHIKGEGTDRRGGSRGQVVVDYGLSGSEESATVTISAELSLSGAAAQFGRTSLVQEISGQIIAEFADCLETRLTGDPATGVVRAPPSDIRVGSLVFRSLVSQILATLRRWFGRNPSKT